VALSPAEDKKTIGIDQIRELIATVGLTPQYGGHKVAIITPAESMTVPAANSLLKTLEEPPGDSLFLLIARHSASLPATIRSRCQILDFRIPSREGAVAWLSERLPAEQRAEDLLAMTHGAPLEALAMANSDERMQREQLISELGTLAEGSASALEVAKGWQRVGVDEIGCWLLSYTADLIRVKFGTDAGLLTYANGLKPMQQLAERLDLKRLFRLYDRSLELRRIVDRRLNFNEQLLLEDVAAEWGETLK